MLYSLMEKKEVFVWIVTSTFTELFIASSSIYSLTLMISSVAISLQTFQLLHLLHLLFVSLPGFWASSKIFYFLTNKLCVVFDSSKFFNWYVLNTEWSKWSLSSFTCKIVSLGFIWYPDLKHLHWSDRKFLSLTWYDASVSVKTLWGLLGTYFVPLAFLSKYL